MPASMAGTVTDGTAVAVGSCCRYGVAVTVGMGVGVGTNVAVAAGLGVGVALLPVPLLPPDVLPDEEGFFVGLGVAFIWP